MIFHRKVPKLTLISFIELNLYITFAEQVAKPSAFIKLTLPVGFFRQRFDDSSGSAYG